MKISDHVEKYKNDMVKTLSELIAIKAIAPEYGGNGEYEKAEYLMNYLNNFDYVKRFDARDERVSEGYRPNIVAKVYGALKRTIWIVSHLDVVPEGDAKLWSRPPFKPAIENGKVFGRGSEDNGQSIVSSLYAAKTIIDLDLTPKYTLGLVFVSDEEAGSNYGVKYLINQNVFKKEDMIIVPDVGSPKGDLIEIAEKSILWIKFVVHGNQSHASLPKGINAARRAMKFILDLDEKLHSKFNARDDIFIPPNSTFEPTKREKNVDNINTIPGIDVSYLDCRILPNYDPNEVIEFIENVKRFHEMKDGAKIELEVIQNVNSPPTPETSEIVLKLKKTIETLRELTVRYCGIGGNTCASFFRREGFIDTAAWCTVDGLAHQPNEYCKINNMVEDAKVFALLPFDPGY